MDVLNFIKEWIENISYWIFLLGIGGVLLATISYPFLRKLYSYKAILGLLMTGFGFLSAVGLAIIAWLIVGMCLYKFYFDVIYYYHHLFG